MKFGVNTTATSSPNYNIVTGNDDNQDGEFNERPPGVERNSGEGEPLWTFDTRVSKVVTIQQNFKLEFMLEVFNLFNRDNVGGFVGNLQSSQFGEPTGLFPGFDPRQVQLAVRLDF